MQNSEEDSVAYALTTGWHSTVVPIPETHGRSVGLWS